MSKTVRSQPAPSEDRLRVLARIAELEREGRFDIDAEDDPETVPLTADMVTYLDTSLSARIKRTAAFAAAHLFFYIERVKKHIILAPPVGIENLSTEGGAIITCNHFNPYDSFIMQLLHDRSRRTGAMHRIIREGNYTSFGGFYGFLMRNCNTMPLSRDVHCVAKLNRAISTALARGDSVLIYPEQSLWWNYRKPKPTKSGAFDIAVRHGVPVIPVFITMEDSDIIGEDGFPVQICTPHVGEPIYPSSELGKREASEELNEHHFAFWRSTYESFYKRPLEYECNSI